MRVCVCVCVGGGGGGKFGKLVKNKDSKALFAPAKMNWGSRRMYNTNKQKLYVLHGLICSVGGVLNTL